MDFDTRVKLSIYHHFAETGRRPELAEICNRVGTDPEAAAEAYQRLAALRVLVLEADGTSVRMASPFSGVPTQHVVESNGIEYFANCAWDALGVVAALQRRGTVHSRCEQSREPLDLEVDSDGPSHSEWLFHCLVPAARWWDDIVFT